MKKYPHNSGINKSKSRFEQQRFNKVQLESFFMKGVKKEDIECYHLEKTSIIVIGSNAVG